MKQLKRELLFNRLIFDGDVQEGKVREDVPGTKGIGNPEIRL